MKMRLLLLLGLGMLFGAAGLVTSSNATVENKGAAEITISGGKQGSVPFPHHLHQNTLVDCNVCHSLYPQKPGIIEEFKAQGKLKAKQVMNKQCTKCHRQKRQEGVKAGPTTCTKCHIK